MRPGHVAKKAKKKVRHVTSLVCAQTTHVVIPPSKLSCVWGTGRSQPRQSFVKIGQGVLVPWGVEICHFPMLNAPYGLYNDIDLPPNLWFCVSLKKIFRWHNKLLISIVFYCLFRRIIAIAPSSFLMHWTNIDAFGHVASFKGSVQLMSQLL